MPKHNAQKIKGIVYKLSPLIAFFLLILAWYVGAKIIDIAMILPSPKQTLQELWILMQQATFYSALWGSVQRCLISFFVCFIVALLCAILGYLVPIAHRIMSPWVSIMRAVPTMSVILLTVLWLSSNQGPMFVAGLISFPILYASFYEALQGTSKALIDVSTVYKVPVTTQISKLYIPHMMPTIFMAIGSGIGLNFKVIIATEVLTQTYESIGIAMQQARIYLETAELLAWTISAIVISFIMEAIVRAVRKIVIKWEKKDA